MEALYNTLIATILVSLISFVGLFFASKFVHKYMRLMISFAAGALLAAAFFELMPESASSLGIENALLLTLAGFVVFFIFDRFIFWYHCHKNHCKVHSFTYLNLIGDGLHNFIDGMIIAASFMTDFALGISTTTAVVLHEIPQEISDFSILIYGGLKKKKALIFNFLTALTAIVGALVVYYFSLNVEMLSGFLIAIAAGSFIYISGSDLIPEIHKEEHLRLSVTHLATFIVGILVMWIVGGLFH